MSDIAAPDRVFAPVTVVVLLVTGILGFAASMLLGAYAPDFRPGRNAGAHALSNAATGYAGLVELARATGRNPVVLRDEDGWDTEDLVVATPEHGFVDMTKFMQARAGRATLIVLPKWATVGSEKGGGWVDAAGLLPPWDPAGILAPATKIAVEQRRSGGRPLHPVTWAPRSLAIAAPRPIQTIAGSTLAPLLTDATGRIVLARIGDSSIYILSDPDLLDNYGIRRLDGARAALDLLDFVNSTGADGIVFDVTLNGLGRGRSPLKLAFELPFLPMTLAVAVALALAGWQALVRFGTPQPRGRAIAFGKAALVDNSAMIVRKAGREGRLGARYTAVIRERARAAFGIPAALTDAAADRHLDALAGSAKFGTLVADAERAEHRADMLAAAQALHQWQMEKTR